MLRNTMPMDKSEPWMQSVATASTLQRSISSLGTCGRQEGQEICKWVQVCSTMAPHHDLFDHAMHYTYNCPAACCPAACCPACHHHYCPTCGPARFCAAHCHAAYCPAFLLHAILHATVTAVLQALSSNYVYPATKCPSTNFPASECPAAHCPVANCPAACCPAVIYSAIRRPARACPATSPPNMLQNWCSSLARCVEYMIHLLFYRLHCGVAGL